MFFSLTLLAIWTVPYLEWPMVSLYKVPTHTLGSHSCKNLNPARVCDGDCWLLIVHFSNHPLQKTATGRPHIIDRISAVIQGVLCMYLYPYPVLAVLYL
jgi:hypothetical protein